MSKKKLYIVTAYRWGDRQHHSYVIGVFSKKQKAINEAEKEERHRGGKYRAEVIETEIDVSYAEDQNPDFKRIKELK